MPSQTFTVTHPDGSVSKRTSKTRNYGFAVEVGPASAEGRAAALERRAAQSEAAAEKLRAAAAQGKVRKSSRGWVSDEANLHGWSYGLVGSEEKSPKGHTYLAISDHGNANWQTEALIETVAERGLAVIEDVAPGLSPERWVVVDVRPYLVARAVEAAERYEESAREDRAQAAEIRAKGEPVGKYSVPRWSSRADLAAAYISGEGSYYVEQGYTARVVPAVKS